MSTAPATLTLPILPLPYPQVLLPGAKLSFLVSKKLVDHIADFIQDNEGRHQNVVIGGVPVIPAPGVLDAPVKEGDVVEGKWSKNACSAKLLGVVRPASLLSSQMAIVTLQGLQRIQLLHAPSVTPTPLSSHDVSHPSTLPHATSQTSAAFRSVTAKLLSRLAEDERQQAGDTGREKKRGPGIVISLGGTGRDALYARLTRLVRDAEEDQLPAVADMIIHVVGGDFEDRVEYLGYAAGEARLSKATHIITRKLSLLEVNSAVVKSVEDDLSRQQREYILRTQMAAIQRELSRLGKPAHPVSKSGSGTSTPTSESDEFEGGDDESELSDLKSKISLLVKGSEERKVAVREFRRLRRIPPGSVETSVIRNYLDWLVALPWPTESETAIAGPIMERSFLVKARQTLDADHFGLEKVKQRLIEYLAVVRLKQIAAQKEAQEEKDAKLLLSAGVEETALVPVKQAPSPAPTPTPPKPKRVVSKGPILLLYGPPGVGKTSIAQSLARALDRPFQRISLGGVRDEAEIRGHRRTYVASGPGNIVQALRKAGRLDPVILLDEIDKVSHSNFHGDPAAALLEVLDPEQNWSFKDHYMSVPVDLSQVLFIATANTLDTISAPLLDRCEVLRLPGYTSTEKLRIAQTYLIPKQLTANGMDTQRFQIEQAAVERVIRGWTREAGVRNLERLVGAVVRAKAVEWSERQAGEEVAWDPVVREEELEKILGPERFDGEERELKGRRGVVYGLVVMGEGEGGILPVETAILPGTGQLRLSGSLGEVIRESAELALSWVKSHAYPLGLTPTASTDPLKHPDAIDVHLHLPAGAQKKDGPSAGIAMICAFVSLLSGVAVPSSIAMTGEITLRGAVTPVGGVKEKVLGAHRAGIRKVLLPKRNKRDVFGINGEGVPEEVRVDMEFVFVERVEEALAAAFADGQGERKDLVDQWVRGIGVHVESRL